MKKCTICKTMKSLSEYYSSKKSSDNKTSECISCFKQRMKIVYQNSTEQRKANSLRYKLMTNYGITVEQRSQMLIDCESKCAICHKELLGFKEGCSTASANIDHCHTTGRVRGILCGHCNKGLGHFYDNTSLLQSAIDYLNKDHNGFCN